MSDSQPTLRFVRTEDTEPQEFRLYIALFSLGIGTISVGFLPFSQDVVPERSHTDLSSKHWGLVMKDSRARTDLLDAIDLDNWTHRNVRDFNDVRRNQLHMICEIGRLQDDRSIRHVRSVADTMEIPIGADRYFCRTWVMNVVGSLNENHVNLYGAPETIQRAIQRALAEFPMQYSTEYHILAPLRTG
ncbi:hypothetical protein F5Y07DRAFT_395894 [Xylaria sp. FL0933]|nr:hypothetical protein F5Y07DRAFT_395894 [Xylaria sp. FL0933]